MRAAFLWPTYVFKMLPQPVKNTTQKHALKDQPGMLPRLPVWSHVVVMANVCASPAALCALSAESAVWCAGAVNPIRQ